MSNQLAKMRYKFYFLTMPKLNKSPRKTVWNTRNVVSSWARPQRSRFVTKARPWQPRPFREMPYRSPQAGIQIWLDPKSSVHMTSRFLPAKILPFPVRKSTNSMTTPSRSRRAACSRVADSVLPSGRRNGKISMRIEAWCKRVLSLAVRREICQYPRPDKK